MHLLVRRLTRLTRLTWLAVSALTVRRAAVLPALLRLGRTVLGTLRALGTAVLRAALLRAAVLLALLRVTLLAGLRALGTAGLLTLLGPEVLALRVLTLRRTVLRLLAAGTWVRGWLVLVGHMLPRWLRWPHRRTCKG
jgi:hypothetical protein